MSELKAIVKIVAIDATSQPIGKVRKSMRGLPIVNAKLEKSSKSATKAIKDSTKSLQETSQVAQAGRLSLGKLATSFSMLVGSGSVIAKLKGALREATLRESLNINIATALGGDKSLGKFKEFFAKIERTGIATYQEIADTGYNLLSAGLSQEQALKGTKVVIEVAKITKGDASSVASVMATASKNFGVEMKRVGKILTKTQIKFQFKDFNQLGEGFAMVGASAAAMQLPIEQTATALGVLNDAGVTGSRAGTGLNAVFRQMGSASQKPGIEIPRAFDGSLDLGKWLKEVASSLNHLSVDEKAMAIQKLFGDEGKNAILPLLQSLGSYNEKLKDVTENSKNIVDKEGQRHYKSFNVQLNKLSASFTQLSVALRKAVIPLITKLINKIIPWINWGVELVKTNKKLAQTFFFLGLAFSGLLTILAVGKILAISFIWLGKSVYFAGKGVMWFIGIMGKLKKVAIVATILKKLSIAFRVMWVAMLGPVGWAIAGITALVGIGYLIIKNWMPVGEFFSNLWENIKSGVSNCIEWIKGLLNPITSLFEKVKSFFGGGNKANTIEDNKANTIVKKELKTLNPTTSTTKNSEGSNGSMIYNNTFNISENNLNAHSIAELVIKRLKEQQLSSMTS